MNPARVLHIAPHLGGGVGKAHATLAEAGWATPECPAEHVYVLLEEPRDIAYAERIRRAGFALHVAPDLETLAALAHSADIVELEWWSHPRLYALLTTNILPEMRLLIWLHVSGLSTPLIPAALVELADGALFTAACSFDAPNLRSAIAARPEAFGVASSAFGFHSVRRPPSGADEPLRVGYLGTLDFAKMHPRFFDLVDALEREIRVRLWGRHDERGEAAERHAAMRNPGRISFEGFATDPQQVLASLDIFLYLLNPEHYGTAENALVEAISAGAVPIVFDNPAERTIVKHRRTGLVIGSETELAPALEALHCNPVRLAAMRGAGAADMAQRFSPERTLADFAAAHASVMKRPKRGRDFAAALGLNARDWFLASLAEHDLLKSGRMLADSASKGSLGHFRACLPMDASLATVRRHAS